MSEPFEREPTGMTRRQFLKQAALSGTACGGALLAGMSLWERQHYLPGFEKRTGVSLPSFRLESSKVLPDLAVAHGEDRRKAIRAALDTLGGIGRFIDRGDIVLIKPNIAFDRPPDLCTTTHPDALRTVAELCFEAGAREVAVADNPINSPISCFLKSGIEQVANELNLGLRYPESSAFADLQMEGDILRNWPLFYQPLKRADKVIGLSPCKDHNLCGASMIMKNWYGLLGGRRNQFHQHIHRIISDFALMIEPSLVILDGINVLMRNGPTGGRLSDVKPMNTVVAGTDMVAVDSYGYTQLLERDIKDLGYVHKADARGLGNRNWKELRMKEVQI